MEKVDPKKEISVAKLLEEKRHKELKDLLVKMLKRLEVPNTEIEYKELDISGIEKAIAEISLSVDISEVPTSIKTLGEILTEKVSDLKSVLEELKPAKAWNFDIIRNKEGLIKNVKARSEK